MNDDDLISRMCVVNAIDIYILSKGHDNEDGRALQRLMAMIMHLPSHGGCTAQTKNIDTIDTEKGEE